LNGEVVVEVLQLQQ